MRLIRRLALLSVLTGLAACLGAQPSGAIAAETIACESGLQSLSLEHDGRSRHYLLYMPAGADADRPVPLVVGLHGGWGRAKASASKVG